jgi:hypothetical protein
VQLAFIAAIQQLPPRASALRYCSAGLPPPPQRCFGGSTASINSPLQRGRVDRRDSVWQVSPCRASTAAVALRANNGRQRLRISATLDVVLQIVCAQGLP